jgi:hypothetical protein
MGGASGFERAMDNLGAVGGPLWAITLVGLVGVQRAIIFAICRMPRTQCGMRATG